MCVVCVCVCVCCCASLLLCPHHVVSRQGEREEEGHLRMRMRGSPMNCLHLVLTDRRMQTLHMTGVCMWLCAFVYVCVARACVVVSVCMHVSVDWHFV